MKNKKERLRVSFYLFCIIFIAISLCLQKYLSDNRYYIGAAIGIIFIVLKLTQDKRQEIRYLKSGIKKIDKMSGEEFEECLKAHFKKLGYSVMLTQTSRDFGADLIIQKDKSKIAVQAKRYSNTVGISAVQQIYAAASFYDCNESIVVTNSFYSSSAVKLANKIGVDLWDRNTIINTFNIK